MRISTVIATYNRIALVPRQLAALDRMERRDELDVIYVDNNSADGTFELLTEECAGRPGFRAVRETRRGSSAARNLGASLSTADYVWFIDDDSFPHPDALAKYLEHLPAEMPEVAGGRTRPISDTPVPWWFGLNDRAFASYVAKVDFGDVTRFLDRGTFWGPNMLIRRDIFEKYGGFNLRYGVDGGKRAGGEEDELQGRIKADGGRTFYVHEAVVDHLVLAEKMRLPFYLKQRYDRGTLTCLDRQIRGLGSRSQSAVSTAKVVAHAVASAVHLALGRPYKAVDHLGACYGHAGMARQSLRSPPPSPD